MGFARYQSPPGLLASPVPTGNSLMKDTSAEQVFEQRLVLGILVAAVSYQALLCLINTQVFSVSRAMVGLAEAVILAACLPLLVRRLLPGVIVILALMGALLCLLTLLSGELEIKAFRDLLIPLAFFWLGCNIGRPELADRALTYAFTVVLTMGLFEFFFARSLHPIFQHLRLLREGPDAVRRRGLHPGGEGPLSRGEARAAEVERLSAALARLG